MHPQRYQFVLWLSTVGERAARGAGESASAGTVSMMIEIDTGRLLRTEAMSSEVKKL